MSKYDKSIVASGHPLVSKAAGLVLETGGNAFDAIVAAGFASAIVEPALTSLGGGGFMLGHNARTGQDIFFDFFVDTPGRGRNGDLKDPDFFGVTVEFSGSSQVFNVGFGSVAVPGTLKGLLHIHKRLGKMPLSEVLVLAQEYAEGHLLNEQQAHFLKLLHPIMTLTGRGRDIYGFEDSFLQAENVLINHNAVTFLEQIVAEGDSSFYTGDIARQIHREMEEGRGFLTFDDLAGYEVKERQPLAIPYRGSHFLTAPEPSMGGTLIGLSLSLMEQGGLQRCEWGSEEHLSAVVGLMHEVERLRGEGVISPVALQQFLADPEALTGSVEKMRLFSRGTTHVSIADKDGNCASMTCSNGEGSGYFAPGTGVMLNNMMGEDDLHPDGFHSTPAGERVYSMMSPSMLMKDGNVKLVIGSGGSKRIRIAISQVLSQLVDFDRSLQQSVDAPRLYLDEGTLQAEPGFETAAIEAVEKLVPVNIWSQKDVYFGGVHAVIPGAEGAGDPRRGGSVVTVPHPKSL